MSAKKILFLSPYPFNKAPSQRLKYEQYFSAFEQVGYIVKSDSFISEKLWGFLYIKGNIFKKAIYTALAYFKRYLLLGTLYKYDLVYVHLWGTPFGAPVFERLLRAFSRKLIYDIDDLIYLRDTNEANKFLKNFKGKSKSFYLMRIADHVITCTPRLDDFVKKFNSHTTDISSTVDTEKRYLPKADYESNDIIKIGWSGSYSTSKYLYLLKDVLIELSKSHKFQLVVMGDKDFYIEGVNIKAIPWSEENEMTTLKSFDIGIYPLPDEEWVYGKSGLKAIQYMALGIPTIATAIGANFRIITDGVNGFLIAPDNYEKWSIRLAELIQDAELRKRLGREGRKKVEEKYSIHTNAPHYLQILNSLTAR